MSFQQVSERPSFPAEEEKIIEYWRSIDAYNTSLKMSEGKPDYTFYDGPPFATGLPHYGHILAGTIKDVVTRYAHQTGHHVIRKFGWDCHGLPVEYEIDKQFNIAGKRDVMEMGIANYNDNCRSIVQRYTSEWEDTVERFGRWVDFKGGYKTMDRSFMESVWWVFKQLYEKGLVYRAFRVMPYSTACQTPLSNFEKSQAYKTVIDPSVIINFEVVGDSARLLAWTTTPWTLPSNLALAVNPNLSYVRFHKKDETQEYICGKERLEWVVKSFKWGDVKNVVIVSEFPGSELVGKQYKPLFDYFVSVVKPSAFHVIPAEYVTAGAGTCIVHQAPAFGEDDFEVCVARGVIDRDGTGMPCPIDDSGCFTAEVQDFAGVYFKTADNGLKQKLKTNGNLMFAGTESHEYPHCWRSDTPLILKAVSSWFVQVADFREKLVSLNEQSSWVPRHVQEKRFRNWLADARDWSISRNRYWGTPIPLWVSDNFDEVVCIGSIAELEQYTNGRKLDDIHRHFVDDIKIPSKKNPGTYLKRVEEVFDCWFESGSMPYAQLHYPFENKEFFEKNFPAKFIAEGLDQTRGWFYTLHVLAAHLFDKPAFENLIVNGLVLASDGKKMSKRLKNYPDPLEVCGKYGADAVRMYMCNSPVVRAESLRFKEEGVNDVIKEIFLPLYNAYRFLVQEVSRFEQVNEGEQFRPRKDIVKKSDNFTDKWIYAAAQKTIKEVREAFDRYELFAVAPKLVAFLENLTNWYVRMNRDRMRGNIGKDQALASLNVLYDVILDLVVLMAPLTPFITEHIYQNLKLVLPEKDERNQLSVHFVMFPQADSSHALADSDIIRTVSHMQQVVLLGRKIREQRGVNLKTPVQSVTVLSSDPAVLKDVAEMEQYICDELNAIEVKTSSDVSGIQTIVKPNFAALKARFVAEDGENEQDRVDVGKLIKALTDSLKTISEDQIAKVTTPGSFVTFKSVMDGELEFTMDDLLISRDVSKLAKVNPDLEYGSNAGNAVVVIDFTPREDLIKTAVAREISNKVQKLRKAIGLNMTDAIEVSIFSNDEKTDTILAEKKEYIQSIVKKPVHVSGSAPQVSFELIKDHSEELTEGVSIRIVIHRQV
jgi:isoleucyl-tRNA synthetase